MAINDKVTVTMSWTKQKEIVMAREKVADELIDVLIRNELTIDTARDVLARATKRIEQMVSDCRVDALCTRPSSPTGSQKP